MRKELAADLRARFPKLFDEAILLLPDGWYQLVEDLLAELTTIHAPARPDYAGVVDLWIRYLNSTATAYITPNVDTWDGEQAVAYLESVARFNHKTNNTCQICGKPAVGRLKYTDPVISEKPRPDEILCDGHMEARRWPDWIMH